MLKADCVYKNCVNWLPAGGAATSAAAHARCVCVKLAAVASVILHAGPFCRSGTFFFFLIYVHWRQKLVVGLHPAE